MFAPTSLRSTRTEDVLDPGHGGRDGDHAKPWWDRPQMSELPRMPLRGWSTPATAPSPATRRDGARRPGRDRHRNGARRLRSRCAHPSRLRARCGVRAAHHRDARRRPDGRPWAPAPAARPRGAGATLGATSSTSSCTAASSSVVRLAWSAAGEAVEVSPRKGCTAIATVGPLRVRQGRRMDYSPAASFVRPKPRTTTASSGMNTVGLKTANSWPRC